MNVLLTCALIVLIPIARAEAMCDRQPLDGLVEHTDYRGDVCTLSKRLLQDWRAQRAQVEKLNVLARDYLIAPIEQRTDVFMEINYQTLKLKGALFKNLHGRLGNAGNVTLTLLNDPITMPGAPLLGYALKFMREWQEGRWPFSDHMGAVEINLTVRDSDILGYTQLCVAEECRFYDSEGNALIATNRSR